MNDTARVLIRGAVLVAVTLTLYLAFTWLSGQPVYGISILIICAVPALLTAWSLLAGSKRPR